MANASSAAGSVMGKMTVVTTQMKLPMSAGPQEHALQVNLLVAMVIVCHVPGSAMAIMTAETTQMKHLKNALPRRAETVSLLVVMETVSPCAGDVMEMRTALVILMKRDV